MRIERLNLLLALIALAMSVVALLRDTSPAMEVVRTSSATAGPVGRDDAGLAQPQPQLAGRGLESNLLERVKRVEEALDRLVQADSAPEVAGSGLALSGRVQSAVVLFLEISENPAPSTLDSPVVTVSESGVSVDTTFMRVPIRSGLRAVRVERSPSGEADWHPVVGWTQDGNDLRLVYRRVTRYSSATDTEGMGPGLLRIWAVNAQ